jgi:beta-galactosidase
MDRVVMPFNTDWLYRPEDRPSFARRSCSEKGFRRVSLPHANIELPWHNFDNAEYQFVSWYRKHFALPRELKGRRLFVRFDGVMIAAEVFVNGTKVASHKGGYVPLGVDITDHVTFGPRARNVMAVRVDSRERPDIPPYGGVADYLSFGGIYRDVWLTAVSPFFVADVFARPRDVLQEARRLELSVALANESEAPRAGALTAELLDGRGRCLRRATSAEVEVSDRRVVELELTGLSRVKPWDLDSPDLYTARVTLSEAGQALDTVEARFGFRQAAFTKEGPFLLNGKAVNLRGLDRHQTYPHVGGAAPARLQRRDAEIMKWDLGCNIVRTSHYPQSPHFLDRCDEIGLLVFEEIPGWSHIGDAAWKEVSLNDLRQMILRDRNHPSIVLWGVRINESGDDHEFYTETNRLAHQLDPTRQTGGVRCFERSELLEDVYTMNDFTHSGGSAVIREPQQVTGLPHSVPYLITEFNGHMYPTKPFDQEERLVEHALRHARVQNAIAGHPGIAGGIGWCAFDYDTHLEFGSGDRICYHGVSDIFRFPKFAAWFYESQTDPGVRPVVRVASRWKLGERAGGGVEPLVVFSNCECIEVYVGTAKRGTFQPNREAFPHLPHPPFVCTGIGGVWGAQWRDLRVVGFLDGKAVAEQHIACDGLPQQLICEADDRELVADGSDMTRIAFWVGDRYRNPLPYVSTAVRLTAVGPATIVGENPFSLVGGVGAVYLRAGRRAGTVTVTAAAPRLTVQTLKVHIRPCRASG